MSKNTNIEWADHTFNPWTGCTKISPACDNCYAEGWAKRSGVVKWGAHEPRRITSPSNWKQPLRWNAQHDEFHALHGRRQRVFCASLADVFDNAVDPYWRTALFDIIQATPNLDWLLLTKRIGNAWKMMADACGWSVASAKLPLRNVWLGATICNQEEADRDIPKLLETPAAKRFLSMEPLLGPVDLTRLNNPGPLHQPGAFVDALRGGTYGAVHHTGEIIRITHSPISRIDWVIVGGESGPKARPMSIQWARELRDQCVAAGVPFLFKQWGEWAPARVYPSESTGKFAFGDYKHERERFVRTEHYPRAFTAFGARSILEHVGKKAAGRQLDGREWNEVPA